MSEYEDTKAWLKQPILPAPPSREAEIAARRMSGHICRRCTHPQEWHSHDDEQCLSTHPQPCVPDTAPFRCLGYDCMKDGFPAGTPETRCGCPDFEKNYDGY